MTTDKIDYATIIAVSPNKGIISVDGENLDKFKEGRDLKVGSYLEISDNHDCKLLAVIESYRITVDEKGQRSFIIESNPIGTLIGDKFTRGGDSLAIPPTGARPANPNDIAKIYQSSTADTEKFCFSKLAQNESIVIPVNGNKFFNKHFAIVGSTGSGKSHTVAKILQEAIASKAGSYEGLNNSHIVLFDIHNEYKSAFPHANYLGVDDLILPYWLLNSEELEELFLDTEANDHNQRNVFKEAVVDSKKKHETDSELKEKIHYDFPAFFEINEVLKYANEKNVEMVPGSTTAGKQGPLHGKLTNFVSRLENKINDKRFDFLLGDRAKKISFEDTVKQFIGYGDKTSNITIIDLGGIPFEVLSITVSLISRLLFDYGYFYKKLLDNENKSCETPILLVYEEAHKYVPKSDLVKYRASKNAIERIAKEGRKYGVTLAIISQRPSEISETIFSQCNSFVVMRLTNPEDQSYVKRLLPDTLGNLTDTLPSLQSGEALLIGESIIMPSLVRIDVCDTPPSSNDIRYLEVWQEEWKKVAFDKIINGWKK